MSKIIYNDELRENKYRLNRNNQSDDYRNSKNRKYMNIGREIITERDYNKMLKYAYENIRDAYICLLLAGDSGLRKSEIQRANMKDIYNNRLKVIGKGNVLRYVNLTERTIDEIYDNEHEINERNGKISKYGYGNMQHIFNHILVGAGITSNITWHSLRHRYATKLAESGLELHELQQLLGHRWLQSTSVYIHCTNDIYDKATKIIENQLNVKELKEEFDDNVIKIDKKRLIKFG